MVTNSQPKVMFSAPLHAVFDARTLELLGFLDVAHLNIRVTKQTWNFQGNPVRNTTLDMVNTWHLTGLDRGGHHRASNTIHAMREKASMSGQISSS
jgi:hypothetical protein